MWNKNFQITINLNSYITDTRINKQMINKYPEKSAERYLFWRRRWIGNVQHKSSGIYRETKDTREGVI